MLGYLDDKQDVEYIQNEAQKLAFNLWEQIKNHESLEFHPQIATLAMTHVFAIIIKSGVNPESRETFLETWFSELKSILNSYDSHFPNEEK